VFSFSSRVLISIRASFSAAIRIFKINLVASIKRGALAPETATMILHSKPIILLTLANKFNRSYKRKTLDLRLLIKHVRRAFCDKAILYYITEQSDHVRGETRFSDLDHLLLLLSHSQPQGLDLGKQHHHQAQMLADPLLKSGLVAQPQTNIARLLLQVAVDTVESLYLFAEDAVLHMLKCTFSMRLSLSFFNSWRMVCSLSNSACNFLMLPS
jgi:hypothetical protein